MTSPRKALFIHATLVLALLVSAVPAFSQSRVFLTTRPLMGDMGDWTEADKFCQARANTIPLGGKFVAWISTSTFDASSRILDEEFILVDGTTVASGLGALTNNTSLVNNIVLDAAGTNIGAVDVWTGTHSGGTRASDTCSDWTDTSLEGVMGLSAGAQGTWTDAGIDNCTEFKHLYCFEAVPRVPSLPGGTWPLLGFLVLLGAGLFAMMRRRRAFSTVR